MHKLTITEMPAHHHNTTSAWMQHGQSSGTVGGGDPGVVNRSNVSNDTGNDQPHNNMPPFYSLAFIMKL
ncbi:hypothetical protein [Anaeromusa acidaminophila]|uniref:hypothetical protein n=1 Tax=Anaeromusa acidaminophila TaxID=81464 RepID=UPI0012E9D193|nr:hypothetical protein [Anaeromusa acidaminophila]